MHCSTDCSICRCGSPSPVQKAGFMLVEVSFARNVKEKRNVIIIVSVSFCMSACPTKMSDYPRGLRS